MADAAAGLVARGFRVLVLTSRRGYDDPSIEYERMSVIDGVRVRRLWLSSFGKKTLLIRLLAQFLFLSQCVSLGLITRRLAAILVTTSPPMAGAAALVLSVARRAPIKYWVMDVNPDQAIELGHANPNSKLVKIFDSMNRMVLTRSPDVITLDGFMAARLKEKTNFEGRLTVAPPWPVGRLEAIDRESNPFREEHGLEGKFVVMYSGNHSIAHPLTTILEAAEKVDDTKRIVFAFVGGGLEKRFVETSTREKGLNNMLLLPYQPLQSLRFSLSAADLHVITMGNKMVGCVHPSKVYGAMAVARPILYIGPRPSHISDLIEEYDLGWQFRHGDVEGVVNLLSELESSDQGTLALKGTRGRVVIDEFLSRGLLLPKVLDAVSRGL